MNSSATLEQNEAGNNLKLEITQVIRANRARVFDAWTRPEMLRQWFGPGKMTVADANLDLRVGGAYGIAMLGSPDGKDMDRQVRVAGVYKKIVPNELLVFTWRGDWEPNEETLVTIAFRDVPEGTELTLTHERFATLKSRGGHEQGWTSLLDKLAKFCDPSRA
jgi:uncharacterized protein YndB with AHSA1/START domain